MSGPIGRDLALSFAAQLVILEIDEEGRIAEWLLTPALPVDHEAGGDQRADLTHLARSRSERRLRVIQRHHAQRVGTGTVELDGPRRMGMTDAGHGERCRRMGVEGTRQGGAAAGVRAHVVVDEENAVLPCCPVPGIPGRPGAIVRGQPDDAQRRHPGDGKCHPVIARGVVDQDDLRRWRCERADSCERRREDGGTLMVHDAHRVGSVRPTLLHAAVPAVRPGLVVLPSLVANAVDGRSGAGLPGSTRKARSWTRVAGPLQSPWEQGPKQRTG